jgi:hypothetical protein
MDYYIGLALDDGQGWDQMCGNKFVRWWDHQVHYQIGSESWVNAFCGGGSHWACASQRSCYYDGYGGIGCLFDIPMRDTAFASYPLYLINHETGHVMILDDHGSCSYNGVMYQVGSTGCISQHWPTWTEILQVDYHMWNGP